MAARDQTLTDQIAALRGGLRQAGPPDPARQRARLSQMAGAVPRPMPELREPPVGRRPLPGTTAGPLERSVGPPLRKRPKRRAM
jgi:hypothetical protein